MFFSSKQSLAANSNVSLIIFNVRILSSLLLHCKFAYLMLSGYCSSVQNQLGHNKQGGTQLYA
jgi:hypothetical protein